MDRAEELVATARLGDSARWEVVAGALPGDLRRALVRRRGSRAAESRTMQHYVRTYVHTRFESEFVGARSRTTVARPVYLRHYVPRGHTYVRTMSCGVFLLPGSSRRCPSSPAPADGASTPGQPQVFRKPLHARRVAPPHRRVGDRGLRAYVHIGQQMAGTSQVASGRPRMAASKRSLNKITFCRCVYSAGCLMEVAAFGGTYVHTYACDFGTCAL